MRITEKIISNYLGVTCLYIVQVIAVVAQYCGPKTTILLTRRETGDNRMTTNVGAGNCKEVVVIAAQIGAL